MSTTDKAKAGKLTDLLFEIFRYGVDYGQLLMEEEREQEGLFDAFQCHLTSRKTSMPSKEATRRQPHSEKWLEAKRKSKQKAIESFIKYSDLYLPSAK